MNFLKGLREPTRRMVDMSAAWDGSAVSLDTAGILVGTRVASNLGWRNVEALAVGDQVLTFDGGMQTIIELRRKVLWDGEGECPRSMKPLMIRAGTCELTADVMVMPEQSMMIESDAAEAATGDPFALVNASALRGLDGVERVHGFGPIEVVELVFEEDQVVYAEGGLLLLCPAVHDFFEPGYASYGVLPRETAAYVVSAMAATAPFHALAA